MCIRDRSLRGWFDRSARRSSKHFYRGPSSTDRQPGIFAWIGTLADRRLGPDGLERRHPLARAPRQPTNSRSHATADASLSNSRVGKSGLLKLMNRFPIIRLSGVPTVSYTHLRAHETRHDLVCRLLLEKKKT